MNISSSRSLLNKSSRDLLEAWRDTENHWRDARANQFYKEFISPIPKSVASAGNVIQELGTILTKIRKDCE